MIRPLRKRHRLLWIIIAVIIPIVFVNAYLASEKHIRPNNAALDDSGNGIGEVILSDDGHFSYKIHEVNEKFNLTVVLNKPYPSPSVALYIGPAGKDYNENFIILGQLTTSQRYQYNLGGALENKQLLVYDPLKDETFVSIKL